MKQKLTLRNWFEIGALAAIGTVPIPFMVVSCNTTNLEYQQKYKLEIYKQEYSNNVFTYKFYEWKKDNLDNQEKWFLIKHYQFGIGNVENDYQKEYEKFCRELANEFGIKNFKEQVEVMKMWE